MKIIPCLVTPKNANEKSWNLGMNSSKEESKFILFLARSKERFSKENKL
ncbi:hypothetical protein [Chlamydia avium]|nr:hypothetical protein [Chlamydia avium]